MPDMLCSLTRLPDIEPVLEKLRAEGITIRRPHAFEQTKLRTFVEKHFSVGWGDESSVAFSRVPVSCFIALHEDEFIGFAAYECTRPNIFGPTGVDEAYRGKGVGKALFYASLYGLQDLGYVYAVIGSAGPVKFYEKTVGAIVISIDEGKGFYSLKEDSKFLKREPPK